MEYDPNDFSQAAINSGQRKINYALTVVNEKLAKALEALCNALVALPRNPQHRPQRCERSDQGIPLSKSDGRGYQTSGLRPRLAGVARAFSSDRSTFR